MGQTRREFIKDTAIACTVVAAGTNTFVNKAAAGRKEVKDKQTKCPFFDQPLMCNGPDKFGRYKCDA